MSGSPQRSVITGLGVLSPLGNDITSIWQALLQGKSAVRPIRAFDASALPTRIAAEVEGFDAKKYVTDKNARKSLRVMSRPIQLAVSAAQLALDDGKVDKSKLDPTRFGVEFGAGLIPSELPELADAAQVSANCKPGVVNLAAWGEKGLPVINPLWMLKYLPNMPACHISILHDAQGPNNSITESDAASLLALGEAHRILGRGAADFFLVGGCESKINPVSMVRHCLFDNLSRRNDDPERAMRPFDSGRDGYVMGEGSAVLCLETAAHAEKRGANILAEVAGFGSAFDRDYSGKGLARAVRAALKEANMTPGDIGAVVCHGLANEKLDRFEARGLAEVFGPEGAPALACKGVFGNTGAASGCLESVVALLMLRHGVIPPSVNVFHRDPECPLDLRAEARPLSKPIVLKVAYTPLGQCAAAVIRKAE
jgi:3-oxoacyl-[acyl-carrier-protein] synthase II